MNKNILRRQFYKYVSQNILGMVGVSVYILADTFFISLAAGTNGITVLNLSLPIYGVIFALGSMVGIGTATRATLLRSSGNNSYRTYFWNGFWWIILISIPFMLAGLLVPGKVMALMGADAQIAVLGAPYARIFMAFTPCFMLNYLFNAYVRNDGNPNRAMLATLMGSLFNIVFDYLLMFPLGMGIRGAALATGFSPILGIFICCTHLCSKRCTLTFKFSLPKLPMFTSSVSLGISAFVGEITSAVTTAVFNFLILALVGNVGVAAYGIIANIALVGTAIFNGISQGAQPLLSENHGKGLFTSVNYMLRLALTTAFGISAVLVIVIFLFTDPFVAIFNSENSAELASLAHQGMRLYFIGYLFAGANIVITGFFSAVSLAKQSAITSILRGFIAISGCACLLAFLFGLTGVWCSFAAAEGITLVVGLLLLKKCIRR